MALKLLPVLQTMSTRACNTVRRVALATGISVVIEATMASPGYAQWFLQALAKADYEQWIEPLIKSARPAQRSDLSVRRESVDLNRANAHPGYAALGARRVRARAPHLRERAGHRAASEGLCPVSPPFVPRDTRRPRSEMPSDLGF